MINLKENETILKTYPISEHKIANDKALNKAIAFPEFGFRLIVDEQNVSVIARKNDKTSKIWKTGI